MNSTQFCRSYVTTRVVYAHGKRLLKVRIPSSSTILFVLQMIIQNYCHSKVKSFLTRTWSGTTTEGLWCSSKGDDSLRARRVQVHKLVGERISCLYKGLEDNMKNKTHPRGLLLSLPLGWKSFRVFEYPRFSVRTFNNIVFRLNTFTHSSQNNLFNNSQVSLDSRINQPH